MVRWASSASAGHVAIVCQRWDWVFLIPRSESLVASWNLGVTSVQRHLLQQFPRSAFGTNLDVRTAILHHLTVALLAGVQPQRLGMVANGCHFTEGDCLLDRAHGPHIIYTFLPYHDDTVPVIAMQCLRFLL